MTYYIILDGEDPGVARFDSGILGETSKSYFYPSRGFYKLFKIANESPDLLEGVRIFDDTNKQLTIEQFLDVLNKHTIKKYTNN